MKLRRLPRSGGAARAPDVTRWLEVFCRMINLQKLAFSTLPCENWPLTRLIEACNRYGYAGIEWREAPGSLLSLDRSDAELAEMASRLQDAGIAVTNIGSSLCLKGGEEDPAKLETLRRLAEMAEILGAKGIRVFLGNFARRKDDPLAPIDYRAIVAWIRQACETAAQHRTSIWVETHNEYATGAVLRGLLDEVDRDNCGVIYDIIHPLEDGERPAETIALLGEQCVHVHMKDGRPSGDPLDHDWRYTLIGEGEVPLREIVQTLASSGYDGYYSLEWESKWRKELQIEGASPDEVLPHYRAYMEQLFEERGMKP